MNRDGLFNTPYKSWSELNADQQANVLSKYVGGDPQAYEYQTSNERVVLCRRRIPDAGARLYFAEIAQRVAQEKRS